MATIMIGGTFLRTNARNLVNFLKNSAPLAVSNPSRLLFPAFHHNKYVTVAKANLNKEEIKVTFIRKNGERIEAKGKEGDNLLDVVVNNNLDFDGFGACEGTLTCSTCHVILKQADYDRLPEKPTDEEFDMLDLAYDLCDTSRLGCQIQLTKDLNGLEVELPATVNDARIQ